MKMFLLFLTLLSASLFSQTPIVNTLQLTNGKILQGKVEIERKSFGKDQIVFNDTITYALEDVDRFETSKDTFMCVAKREAVTVTKYLSWNKREISISIHSSGQLGVVGVGPGQVWDPGAIYMPGPSFPVEVKDYYFMQDELAYNVNYSNLRKALADNVESQRHLDSYRDLDYWYYGSWVAAAALIGIGLSQVESDGVGNVLPWVVGGAAVLQVQWFIVPMQDDAIQDAIDTYNRRD
jgi:hypothetical protein